MTTPTTSLTLAPPPQTSSGTLALSPGLLRALETSGGKLLQRAIPSSGEMLPVIGFGSRPTDDAAIKQVLEALVDNGGRVVDTLHGGPSAEQAAGAAANELGIQDKIFWTMPVSVVIPLLPGHAGPTPKVDPAAVPYFSLILVHRRGEAWQ